jgi:hypothetical protein
MILAIKQLFYQSIIMANTYKVSADKGFQILSAVFPNLIFINGPIFSKAEEFADRFNPLGFNVLKLHNIYQRLAAKFKPKKSKDESISYIHDHFARMDDEAELGEFPKDITDALIDELHRYFDRFRKVPCVIMGNIGSMGVLDKIFDTNHSIYTYVYVYPNNSKEYQRRVMDAIMGTNVTKMEYLSPFETLAYEYQAWKKAPKEAKENAKKTFQGSYKKYVKAMLARRKSVFTTHSEDLERSFVILD